MSRESLDVFKNGYDNCQMNIDSWRLSFIQLEKMMFMSFMTLFRKYSITKLRYELIKSTASNQVTSYNYDYDFVLTFSTHSQVEFFLG